MKCGPVGFSMPLYNAPLARDWVNARSYVGIASRCFTAARRPWRRPNRCGRSPLTMASSARSLLSVNGLVVAALLAGFLSNVALAALFGLTRRIDAFYAALVLPNLFMWLCIDYLGKNFMPLLARAKRESEESASRLTSSMVTIVGLLAVAVALLLVLISRPLFSVLLPGFDQQDIGLVAHLFTIMAPTIVLSAVTVFHEYVCQHDEQFVRIAAIRMVLPLTNLAFILIAGPFFGEVVLPIAFTVGQLIVFVLMAWQANYRYSPRLTIRAEWEKQIFVNTAIIMTSGLFVRTRVLIENYLASLLGGGVIAALQFAYRMRDPLERTMFTGVRMLMFSRTARLAAARDTRDIARLYEFGLGATFLLLSPLLWWVGLNSAPIVQTFFERGAFDAGMTATVALILSGVIAAVAFSGATGLLTNAFYAMQKVAVPALVMPVGTLVYLAAVGLMFKPLGLVALAITPSLVSSVVFFSMLYFLRRQVPELPMALMVGRLLLHAAIGGAAIWLPGVVLARFVADPVVSAAAGLIAGLLLYVATLAALRDWTLIRVYEYVRRAGPRRVPAGRTLP